MRVEVIVFRFSDDSDVDLQQCLPEWVGFADVPNFHLTNLVLGRFVCPLETGLTKKIFSGAFESIRRDLVIRRFPGKAPSKRAVVSRAHMVRDPLSDFALCSSNVQMASMAGKEIDAAGRSVCR